jgi:hypothetical protein
VRSASFLAAGLALAALASPAAAHRGHASLSVVLIEADSGRVSIYHRMAAHDVEPALITIAPDHQPSLDDPDTLKALETYGARAFVLEADGVRAPLTHTSTRLAGDQVELVYSTRIKPPAKSVTVDSNLFEETHADQENQVNVRRAKVTKTAVFRSGQGPQQISFD